MCGGRAGSASCETRVWCVVCVSNGSPRVPESWGRPHDAYSKVWCRPAGRFGAPVPGSHWPGGSAPDVGAPLSLFVGAGGGMSVGQGVRDVGEGAVCVVEAGDVGVHVQQCQESVE